MMIFSMLRTELVSNGYVCIPYSHTHESVSLKDKWQSSNNISSLYFVTATISSESKPYFNDSSNSYLLAKFQNSDDVLEDIKGISTEKLSFVFSVTDNLFEREVDGLMNFISIYYVEYGESDDDFREIAISLAKRDKVEKAGFGKLQLFSSRPPKFSFPYSNNIIILEVCSDKSHQSVNTYCEKTRRDLNRKGFTMTNLMSLSILEQLK